MNQQTCIYKYVQSHIIIIIIIIHQHVSVNLVTTRQPDDGHKGDRNMLVKNNSVYRVHKCVSL